jgi:hypothetical protein
VVQFMGPRDGEIRAYFVFHYSLSQFITAVLPNNKTKNKICLFFLLTDVFRRGGSLDCLLK